MNNKSEWHTSNNLSKPRLEFVTVTQKLNYFYIILLPLSTKKGNWYSLFQRDSVSTYSPTPPKVAFR